MVHNIGSDCLFCCSDIDLTNQVCIILLKISEEKNSTYNLRHTGNKAVQAGVITFNMNTPYVY